MLKGFRINYALFNCSIEKGMYFILRLFNYLTFVAITNNKAFNGVINYCYIRKITISSGKSVGGKTRAVFSI